MSKTETDHKMKANGIEARRTLVPEKHVIVEFYSTTTINGTIVP